MSYKGKIDAKPYPKNNIYIYLEKFDESIIHINKHRFIEFYYEELDKCRKSYYFEPDIYEANIPGRLNTSGTRLPEHPDTSNNVMPVLCLGVDNGSGCSSDLDGKKNNRSPLVGSEDATKSASLVTPPINIPYSTPNQISKINTNMSPYNTDDNTGESTINSSKYPNEPRINRTRLDSLNNFINSPPVVDKLISSNSLDISMSPPIERPPSCNSNLLNDSTASAGLSGHIDNTTAQVYSPAPNVSLELNASGKLICDYYIPSTSHQMIVKRVYDNYISLNIDTYLNQLTIQSVRTRVIDFIFDQLVFVAGLINSEDTYNCEHSHNDPFNLLNLSTLGLIFDRMNKSGFSFSQGHSEIIEITKLLTKRLNNKLIKLKQGFLDAAIGIISHTTQELLQPNIMVANILLRTFTEFIDWVYSNYMAYYWMSEPIIQLSLKVANDLGLKYGMHIVKNIYTATSNYFIPSYLFSTTRHTWKFTSTHIKAITRLRGLIIPASKKTSWIIKCIDNARTVIPWVFPDTPQIKNIIMFIDGRNCFYSDSQQHSGKEINTNLLFNFMSQGDYHIMLADQIHNKIVKNMTAGRQLAFFDPRFVIPVCIFNERHKQHIQHLMPNNRYVIYTPRGQDDDLITLYLWLSNPGSFIVTNDNYGNHIAKLANHPKYYEGLWSELVKNFKLLNPFSQQPTYHNFDNHNSQPNAKYTFNNYNIPSTI